jgi:hypothetical protein
MKFYIISEEKLREVIIEAVTHARHFPSVPSADYARLAVKDFIVPAIGLTLTDEENRIERLGHATLAGLNKESIA